MEIIKINMKKINIKIEPALVLFVLIFINAGYVFSQADAGPDKSICTGDNCIIGGNPVSGGCYVWTPATGLSNPNILHPTASPATTTTYTLTVVGPNFSFTDADAMTVTVAAGVNGMSASPIQCCWKKGDNISWNQFNITTSPPGMNSYLSNWNVDPSTAPAVTGATGSVDVTISAVENCGGGNNLETTTSITVVDEDWEVASYSGLGGIDVDGIAEAIDNLVNKVKVGPCSPSSGFSGSTSTHESFLCCDNPVCVKKKYKYAGNLHYDAAITCDFPFFGVPYIASLNFRFELGCGAQLSIDYGTTCTGNEVCLGVGCYGSLGGGVSGTVLGGALLDAQLLFVATLSIPGARFCIPSGQFTWDGKICAQGDIVGQIKIFTFITKKVTVNVISKRCW